MAVFYNFLPPARQAHSICAGIGHDPNRVMQPSELAQLRSIHDSFPDRKGNDVKIRKKVFYDLAILSTDPKRSHGVPAEMIARGLAAGYAVTAGSLPVLLDAECHDTHFSD